MGREYDGVHRTTLIDENGLIDKIIKVNTKNQQNKFYNMKKIRI